MFYTWFNKIILSLAFFKIQAYFCFKKCKKNKYEDYIWLLDYYKLISFKDVWSDRPENKSESQTDGSKK